MYYENMMGMHAVWWVFWVGLVISLLFWGGAATQCAEASRARHRMKRCADGWQAVKSVLTSMKNEKCF